VSWFRKNKKPEYEVETHDVPLSTMVRWFLHDIGYGEDQVDDLIGLSPISEEGIDKEIEDSNRRLSSLYTITPYIETMAEIASNVLSTIAIKSAEEHGDSLDGEKDAELLTKLYYSIALSSIIGAFSIASSLGIIDVSAIAAENKDIGDMFYE
jgi:hypothetical protein